MTEPADDLWGPRLAAAGWYGTWLVMVALSLMPVWAVRMPPLQDYPQHLLQVKIATSLEGSNELRGACQVSTAVRPYSMFFLSTLCFSKYADIETAGKLSLTVLVLLTGILVLVNGRPGPGGEPRWGALLLFPLAFHQQYYLGNLDYCLSLPIALMGLGALLPSKEAPTTGAAILRTVVLSLILFAGHPSVLLAYAGLGLVAAIHDVARGRAGPGAFLPVAAPPLALALWFVVRRQQNTGIPGGLDSAPSWSSLGQGLAYILLPFTDFHCYGNPIGVGSVLWLLAGLLVARAWWNQRGQRDPASERLLCWCALTVVAVFVLPMQWGQFSFVGYRYAALSYGLLGLVAARRRIRGASALACVILAGALTAHGVLRQCLIASESTEILPLIDRMAPGERVLPLDFDPGSTLLDAFYFDVHLHDPNYYHLLKNGGLDPYLPDNDLHHVQYRPGKRPPAPDEYFPQQFRWAEHAAPYRYFLLRGEVPLPPDLDLSRAWMLISRTAEPLSKELAGHVRHVATSGRWVLLEKSAPDH